MNPFDGLAKFAVGWIHEGHLQGWIRLLASILMSSFIALFGISGLSVVTSMQMGAPALVALVLGLAHGCIAMSACAASLWIRSPLTKGIPILYPGKIEAERLAQLQNGGEVYVASDRK